MSEQRRAAFWLALPIALATTGTLWMALVTQHYERVTGRPFYGLAALMHSVPEWGTTYFEGGHDIERWSVNVPSVTTLILVLLSVILLVTLEWKRWKVMRVLLLVVWHALVAAAFCCVVVWFSINITGLFI